MELSLCRHLNVILINEKSYYLVVYNFSSSLEKLTLNRKNKREESRTYLEKRKLKYSQKIFL